MKKVIALACFALSLSVLAADFGSIGVVIVDRNKGKGPLRTGVVYPGSPAEQAGIKPDGFLISVNGTNVVNMSLEESMKVMHGPVGAPVTLEIADLARSHTNTFTVKRVKTSYSHGRPDFSGQ